MAVRYLLVVACMAGGSGAAAQVAGAAAGFGFAHLGVYHPQPHQALAFGGNQGALAHYAGFTATAYGEKRFLLDDLSLLQVGLVLPTASGAFGLQAASFGSAAYNEGKIGLAYGRSLSSKISLGVQFNYEHMGISGYGNRSAASAEAGLLFRFSESVAGGLHVYNLAGSLLGRQESDGVPQVFAAGLGYTPSDVLHLSATVSKETYQPLNLQAGLQYRVLEQLQVTAGVATATAAMYFGAGYSRASITVDAVAAWHPQLGISPGLMITYNKKHE